MLLIESQVWESRSRCVTAGLGDHTGPAGHVQAKHFWDTNNIDHVNAEIVLIITFNDDLNMLIGTVAATTEQD